MYESSISVSVFVLCIIYFHMHLVSFNVDVDVAPASKAEDIFHSGHEAVHVTRCGAKDLLNQDYSMYLHMYVYT